MRKLIVFFLLVSCKTPENEWVSLIKNNSLDGWHIFQDNGSKKGWYVENEILIFDKISGLESGEDDSSLLSNKTYTSFEITFDWKIEEGGNSGFMWGVSDKKEYKYPYQTGPEIQIIDPSVYEKPQDVLGGDIELNNVLTDLEEKKHFLGSVYDLFSVSFNEFILFFLISLNLSASVLKPTTHKLSGFSFKNIGIEFSLIKGIFEVLNPLFAK